MLKGSENTSGSAGGTCAGCLKRQGARTGACGTCLRLDDAVVQVTRLREELKLRREQLETLLHDQRAEENRRFQLFSLHQQASDTRGKALLAEQRLAKLLSSCVGDTKTIIPRFANSVILRTALDQLDILHNKQWADHSAFIGELRPHLERKKSEEHVWRHRALSDVLHCLHEIKTWPEKLLPSGHGSAKKAGSERDNTYPCVSDIYGQIFLLMGMMANVMQAPLIHFGRFAGAKSEVWVPITFWNVHPASKDQCYTLCSHNTTAGLVGTPLSLVPEQAILLLETSLAMLYDNSLNSQPTEDTRSNPINWMIALCTAYNYLEDDLGRSQNTGGCGNTQVGTTQQSHHRTKDPDADDTSGDDSWELMDSIEGQIGDDREASSGLHSFIDRIRKMIQ